MRRLAQAQQVGVYGIDIGKSVFHVAGLDRAGHPVLRTKFKRDALLQFFSNVPLAIVAMEACPGSQWLARKLHGHGHTARILPAQFVKPYVKSNKNDNVDAEAIAEAATRPTMRLCSSSIWNSHAKHPRTNLPTPSARPRNRLTGWPLDASLDCLRC
jgi:transposase